MRRISAPCDRWPLGGLLGIVLLFLSDWSRFLPALVVALFALMPPSVASGQGRVAAAADVGLLSPGSEGLEPGATFGGTVRVPARKTSIVITALHVQPESAFLRFRLTPVMVGIGYAWSSARLVVAPTLVAGYAFNSAAIKGDTQAVQLTNCFSWQPETSVVINATHAVSVGGAVGYLFARPTLDFGNTRGSPPSKQNMNGLRIAFRIELTL